MPKYRQLHTKIIDSFDFNEMPNDFTRVVWMLLALILDREGRGIDSPEWIKSKMFPLRQDVTIEQIVKVFDWLEKREMIFRYQIKDRHYFCIPTFQKYQSRTEREAPSVLPTPIHEQVTSNSGINQEQCAVSASASASESESESVNAPHRIFESQFQDHGPFEAERLYQDITNQISIPSDHKAETLKTLIDIRESYDDPQKAILDGKKIFKRWCDTKSKTTGKAYSRTNTAWLNKWLEELAPTPPEKKFEDCVTVEEMIEWRKMHPPT